MDLHHNGRPLLHGINRRFVADLAQARLQSRRTPDIGFHPHLTLPAID